MFFNYRNGLYHLTYAIDDTGSENYRVGYATATSMNGPWTYRGVILEKDLSLGIKGPGHSSIINVPGTDDWYIAYHRFAMPGGNGNNRETTIDRLEFGENGLMQKVIPTLESVDPQTIDLPAAGATVEVSTAARCVVGKVQLVVRVENTDEVPVTVEVSTAYGSKTVTSLAPGKVLSQAFASRTTTIEPGEVEVTASATIDGEAVTTEIGHGYGAHTCQ